MPNEWAREIGPRSTFMRRLQPAAVLQQCLAYRMFRVIRSDAQSQWRGESLSIPYPLLGLVPGIAWLIYFCGKDRRRRYSFSNVLKVFLWGCAVTLPTGVVEQATGAALKQETLWASAAVSFLLIGPVEESLKLAAVWVGIYRSPDFREPIDGIVYAATAAFGFASVENIVYMGFMGPEILLSRVIFATPAHVMFSCMWGYALGLGRFRRHGELQVIFRGLLEACVLHGVYNFVVAVHPKAAMLTLLPLMVFMAWLMTRRIRSFRQTYPFPPIGEGAVICCPNCGAYTLESEKHCSRCGFDIPEVEADTPRYCGRCRALLDPCRDSCCRCGVSVDLSALCPHGSSPLHY